MHSLVARTFFCCAACLRTSAHLDACHMHAWLKFMKKGVCRMCVVSLHLAFSSLMSHPSFSVSVRRLSLDSSVHTFLPYLPVPKSVGPAHLRTWTRSLAIWPSPSQAEGSSPTTRVWNFEPNMALCHARQRKSWPQICRRSILHGAGLPHEGAAVREERRKPTSVGVIALEEMS